MKTWTARGRAIFFRGLATLVNAGVPITRALECLAEQAESPEQRVAAERILKRVSGGHYLHSAMAEEGGFSRVELALLKVAIQTGRMHGVLGQLADLTEKQDGLRRKLGAALVYPAFVLSLCVLLLLFAPVLVFKDLLDLLENMNTDLPLVTRAYLFLSDTLTSFWFYLLLVLLAIGTGLLLKRLTDDPEQRCRWEELVFGLPGLGPVLQSALAAEVSGALATCYQSGVPVVTALELSRETSWSVLFRRRLKEASVALKGGQTLTEALHSTGFYSPMSLTVLSAGEEVGMVSEAVSAVAQACTDDTEQALDSLQKLLEPLLLLLVGVLVGFIAIATLAPTLKMVEGL